jgi:LPS export ABC transporter permease LptF
MRIIRNYLLKEFFQTFFLSISILTFVMLMGNLVKFVNLIIVRGQNFYTILKLFFYLIPYLFTYTLPLGCLFAILLSLGRLASDNEIMAMRVSGLNLFRIVLPLLVIGIILSLFLVIMNDKIIPSSHFASRKTIFELGMKDPASVLEPGVFIDSFDRYIIFIYSVNGNKLSGIRIYEPIGENKPPRTIVAKKGEFISLPEKGILKLKLIDGVSDEPDPKNPSNFYKMNFKTYFMNLNLSKDIDPLKIEKKPKDMNIKELREKIQILNSQGIDTNILETQLHRRFSLAFSAFVFILMGIPIAILVRQKTKSINFGIAILVTVIYYLLLLGFDALSIEGYVLPFISSWFPNIIFLILGLFGLYRVCAL